MKHSIILQYHQLPEEMLSLGPRHFEEKHSVVVEYVRPEPMLTFRRTPYSWEITFNSAEEKTMCLLKWQ